MNITLNINEQIGEYSQDKTLTDIVLDYTSNKMLGIAVAVNGKVIPKSKLSDYRLQTGDKILIIKATQGG